MPRLTPWIVPVVALVFLVSACGDPTTPPPGAAADVTVHAYVDADGTGDYTPGDPVISGATVTLRPTEDGATLTATTDSDGVALFGGVLSGSYVATLSGDIPTGATISGPERPVVVVPFQGGAVDVEFRYVFYPGALTGVVFRDDDGSGEFNQETDMTAPGVEILAFRGTSIDVEPAGTATTGSDGAFRIEPLRAGTYTVLVRAPEPLELVGDSVYQVDVPAAGEAWLWPQVIGDFVIPIAQARDAEAGTTVTVEGVVLADQGTYDFGNRDTYIQDATAGVRLWGLDTDLGLVVGDSVQVVGTVGTHEEETQLTVSEIEVLGTGAVPTPQPVTGAEINSFEYDGQLAITGAVTVTGIAVFGFDAHNVTVEDADGTSFVIRLDSPNEIPSSYWEEGAVYRVAGVAARFRSTGQIKPRGFDDVDEVTSLADIRADGAGARVLFEGVVLADQGTYQHQGRDTYVQDATAGIRLWDLDTELGLEAGDSVRVWGGTSTFNSELQVDVAGVQVLGTGTIPDPRPVTGAEINSFEYDGELGITGAVTVTDINVFSFDAHNVTVEDTEGTSFVIRVDSPNEIPSGYWVVGDSYRITGVIARFRDDGQIKPRGFDDVEEL